MKSDADKIIKKLSHFQIEDKIKNIVFIEKNSYKEKIFLWRIKINNWIITYIIKRKYFKQVVTCRYTVSQ